MLPFRGDPTQLWCVTCLRIVEGEVKRRSESGGLSLGEFDSRSLKLVCAPGFLPAGLNPDTRLAQNVPEWWNGLDAFNALGCRYWNVVVVDWVL